jgi:hypothetical protein
MHRKLALVAALCAGLIALPYVLLPWYARCTAPAGLCRGAMPGDTIVPQPRTGYTLATTIRASPDRVWPWLVQMGQGRAGFYTHAAIENAIGADIHNADSIIPELQQLVLRDTVWLTPRRYMGGPGQFVIVVEIEPARALVFRQRTPNGSIGTWAFILHPVDDDTTRLLFRRRAEEASLFDRVMRPGYVFMDRGMLRGIRTRAELSES